MATVASITLKDNAKNSPFNSIQSDNLLLRRSRVSSKLVTQEIKKSAFINLVNIEHVNKVVITMSISIQSDNDKNFMKSIKMNIKETDSVESIVQLAIQIFNNIFKNEKILVQLSENLTLYKLKPSKKNGSPKDLPGICFIKRRN
jgi:hypothetical protein